MYTRMFFRILSLVIALVFMGSCASRQGTTLQSYEPATGTTVYGLVTNEADTIAFAGRSVNNIDKHFVTGEPIYHFDGNGAVYNEGIISGVCFDGSETAINIQDVSCFEIDRHSTGRTILLTTGFLTASGFLLYLFFKLLPERDYFTPDCCY